MGIDTILEKSNYRLTKNIKDDKLDVNKLGEYILSLQFSDNTFQISIINAEHKCLLLENYIIDNVGFNDELIKTLAVIFESHHLLKAGFWKTVKVIINNQKFALVPDVVFDKNKLSDYLKLNADVDSRSEELHYYKQIKSSTVVVFVTNSKLISWLKASYPNSALHVIHQANAFIEGILNYDSYTEKTMFLMCEKEGVSVAITNKNDLVFFNKFVATTTSDFFKYVASSFQLYGLDQNSSKLVVWGNITKNTPEYLELNKYFKNVSLGGRPPFLKFNYMFDEADDQQYFDLYSTVLCE